jgi:hypothetical protein
MLNRLVDTVNADFENWENTPPNLVTRGMGKITAPLATVLNPIMDKIAPLLEGVVSKTNDFIASAINDVSGEFPDFGNMDAQSFEEWFEKTDKSASDWKLAGIASMTAEGGATGIGGATLLLVDIPASFGLILGFANKIALTYGLPVKTEETQTAILKAICAGSANNLKEKTAAIVAIKQTEQVLQQTWKHIYSQTADNVISTEKLIVVVREFLKKIGINVTKRKAGQILVIIGGIMGAATNCAWASDALEAVRQCSRKWAVEKYCSDNNIRKAIEA